MIVALAQDIQAKVEQRKRFEERKRQQQAISDTLGMLRTLRQEIADFDTQQRLVGEVISAEITQSLNEIIQRLRNRLKQRYDEFRHSDKFNQKSQLSYLQQDISKLDAQLQEGWSDYANRKIAPHSELYLLVEKLPEVSGNIRRINELIQKLHRASSTTPRTSTHVDQFERDLESLRVTLANLEGIEPHIRRFLFSVRDGKATVADLTDDILAWCRDPRRASAFKIQL